MEAIKRIEPCKKRTAEYDKVDQPGQHHASARGPVLAPGHPASAGGVVEQDGVRTARQCGGRDVGQCGSAFGGRPDGLTGTTRRWTP